MMKPVASTTIISMNMMCMLLFFERVTFLIWASIMINSTMNYFPHREGEKMPLGLCLQMLFVSFGELPHAIMQVLPLVMNCYDSNNSRNSPSIAGKTVVLAVPDTAIISIKAKRTQ